MKEVGGNVMPHEHGREMRIFASEGLFRWERNLSGDGRCYETQLTLNHLEKIKINSKGKDAVSHFWAEWGPGKHILEAVTD